MIKTRQDLKKYMEYDKVALSRGRNSPSCFDLIWKFQILLRKQEYHKNNNNLMRYYFYGYRRNRLGLRLGFEISCNVFGPGLRINHRGLLIVHWKCRIGAFCNIHQGVNIGEGTDAKIPIIGNNVFIGPGAKIFGGITIADDIMIGANSAVTKSFETPGVRIAGVPARIISEKGNVFKKDFF